MVRLLVRHGNGHNDAVFERLGHPARTHADLPENGIRLLKIGVVIVQNEWVFVLNGIAQYALMQSVPHLRPGRKLPEVVIVFQVVVDFKMRRLLHSKIEGLIVCLIPTEVLRLHPYYEH
jgi:hypothetical protein